MILLTGGSGFIGSVLLGYLNKKGINNIIVVDKFRKGFKWKNLIDKDYIEFVDKEKFFSSLHHYEFDAIFHIGACSDTTELDMDYLFDNNFNSSKLLLEYTSNKDIPFIFASSAAIYGDGSNGYSDYDENIDSYRPLNAYGYSKYIFDKYLIKENTKKPKHWYSFRFFNVYGPNEYHKGRMASVVMHAYNQLKKDGKIRLFKSHRDGFKDGEQKRDFIYVKDVVEVMYYFYENRPKSGIYNLGTGIARSFNDLAKSVISSSGIFGDIEYFDMPEDIRDKYQYLTQADIDKLRNAGYDKKFFSLEEGIYDYLVNYLMNDKNIYY
ncbi:MAG: ADP-glyceromanno-heptose 6-epimerase [Calditerrivibrio sp.]|nr:ADP-glyceromanno-heptose 6-epimerase [Calditerrivibrio sp.]MCA1980327.1 ADP-glyceromanno-heptose 6-epimerase [Calditerrivibrio sp.]